MKGYESCHDSSSYPKSKGSTEDTQEDAEGLQQGHGLKAVAVVSCRLVRHDGAEGQRDADVNIYMERRNGHQDFGKRNWCKDTNREIFKKWTRASSQICNNPIPITPDITGQVFIWYCLDFEDFGYLLKNSHKDIRHMDLGFTVIKRVEVGVLHA